MDVLLGEVGQVQPQLAASSRILVEKSQLDQVTTEIHLAENVEAPVEAGQILGEMTVQVDGVTVTRHDHPLEPRQVVVIRSQSSREAKAPFPVL